MGQAQSELKEDIVGPTNDGTIDSGPSNINTAHLSGREAKTTTTSCSGNNAETRTPPPIKTTNNNRGFLSKSSNADSKLNTDVNIARNRNNVSSTKMNPSKVRGTGMKADQSNISTSATSSDKRTAMTRKGMTNSKGTSTSRTSTTTNGVSSNHKRKAAQNKRWFRFGRRSNGGRAKQGSITTTGLTLNLDEDHNMLLFVPYKHRALQEKRERGRKGKKVTCRGGAMSSKIVVDLQNGNAKSSLGERVKAKKGQKNVIRKYDETNDSSTTKIIVKDVLEVRKTYSMSLKGRVDSTIDPTIVSGTQIFVTRYDHKKKAHQTSGGNVHNSGAFPSESAPQDRYVSLPPSREHYAAGPPLSPPGGFVQVRDFGGLYVTKSSYTSDEKLEELLKVCKTKLGFSKNQQQQRLESGSSNSLQNLHITKKANTPITGQDGNQNDGTLHGEAVTNIATIDAEGEIFSSSSAAPRLYDLSGNSRKLAKVFSAVVPRGIGKEIFLPEAVLSTPVPPVDDIICIDAEHQIYVCDIGLTSAQCDFIIDTTERCSRGTYAAYTYAKQTLGCRDYDELSTLCEWPVMRAYSSICEHLEGKIDVANHPKKTLVLDDREPHLVKYDTSKKERQKLDMHTDKSDWTFIIALSEGNGGDYDGGGTYMESIDSTIHLQRGHALIFPGKRRHRGQKIINGCRFLLVGFLVEKKEPGQADDDEKEEGEDKDTSSHIQTYVNSVF